MQTLLENIRYSVSTTEDFDFPFKLLKQNILEQNQLFSKTNLHTQIMIIYSILFRYKNSSEKRQIHITLLLNTRDTEPSLY